jgi:predicted AAA+ superfamily ATPase
VENLLFLSYLKINDKYYLADIGLRYFLLGSQKADMGRMIENVVYLELLRRGYDVSVGKFDSNEIDFVAINDKSIEYYQVAQTTREEKTLERELKSLNKISDHNQKFLLTLDEDPLTSYNGIKKINILDWLLDEM